MGSFLINIRINCLLLHVFDKCSCYKDTARIIRTLLETISMKELTLSMLRQLSSKVQKIIIS